MKGHAPITGEQLHRVLRDLGVVIRPPNGASCVAVVDKDEIRIPLDNKRDSVTESTLGRLARALGVSRKELLETLFGRTAINAGKPKAVVPDDSPGGASLADCNDLLRSLRTGIDNIERWIKSGSHGKSLYGRLHAALHQADKALADYPPDPTVGVERLDDSGFRPTQYDSIKTGAARVTGIAAAAAGRRTTVTKWQYDEREDEG